MYLNIRACSFRMFLVVIPSGFFVSSGFLPNGVFFLCVFLPNRSGWFIISSHFYRTVDIFPSLVCLFSLVFPQSSSSHFLLVCLVFSSAVVSWMLKKIWSMIISLLVLFLWRGIVKKRKLAKSAVILVVKISLDSSSNQKQKKSKEKKQKKDVVPTSWSSSNITTLLSIIRDYIVSGNVLTDSGFKNADCTWKHFESEFHNKQTALFYTADIWWIFFPHFLISVSFF